MRLLDSPIYMVGVFLSGMLLLGLGLYVLARLVTRLLGKGEPFDIEARAVRYWNDISEASAPIRNMFPFGLGVALSGGFMIWAAFLGRRILQEGLIGWWAGSIVVIWIWTMLERWFAWPGILIVPEARGTQGVYFARRAERQSGEKSADRESNARSDDGRHRD